MAIFRVLRCLTLAVEQMNSLTATFCQLHVTAAQSALVEQDRALAFVWHAAECADLARLVEAIPCPPGLRELQHRVVCYITVHRMFGEHMHAGNIDAALSSGAAIAAANTALSTHLAAVRHAAHAPWN